MVYYRYKNGDFSVESKQELRKYIVIAQFKQIFGAASNSELTIFVKLLIKLLEIH